MNATNAINARIEMGRCPQGELPPGPSLPPSAQAVLRLWRYRDFSERCHARYGDTFTIRMGGYSGVLTRDREAIRRLFTGDPLVKRHGNDSLRPFLGEYSLLLLEPEDHLTRRKLLLPSFHGQRIEAYTSMIESLVTDALDTFREEQVVRIQPIARNIALDVTLRAVLGPAGVANRQRLRELFDRLFTPVVSIGMLVPQLQRRSRWNVFTLQYWRLKEALDALLFEQIAATRADNGIADRDDILSMMILARDEDGNGLDDEELRDELVTLIVGGHDNTSTAIAWAAELLAHHPAVLARARDGGEDYLDALVKEVLRIRPPVAVGSSRYVLEPFPVGRWTIQPGVAIKVNVYGVHHNPDVFPKPGSFRPERFMKDPPDAYSFLPFGGGAHRCIGSALATLELKVMLREMISRLDISPTSDKLATPVPRGPSLAPKGGARIRIRRTRPRSYVPRTAQGSPAPRDDGVGDIDTCDGHGG